MGKSITFDEGERAAAALADISINVQNPSSAFVEKLRSGDADAFDQLVTKYSPDVFAVAFRLTEDREEANDITQETFLSAVRGIAGFRGDSELKTWLIRIAINHSRNRFRWFKRRKRDQTISLESPVGEGRVAEIDLIRDNRENPEQAALGREREAAIARELRGLPIAFREAVILCDVEGYSYEEVSGILGVGLGTIKSRIARGRSILRNRLRDF
ncbi:MAG TPA: sigma-70 family RNA polymerase sigma factor [Pyrinomonadaceae bacterium]|nr:sigma-70 family RNA polymerase sigma factor [Pyrinomonadaceae bacterium]